MCAYLCVSLCYPCTICGLCIRKCSTSWWRFSSWQPHLVRSLSCLTFRLDALVLLGPPFALSWTAASSQSDVGKISFLPSEIVGKRTVIISCLQEQLVQKGHFSVMAYPWSLSSSLPLYWAVYKTSPKSRNLCTIMKVVLGVLVGVMLTV